MTEINVPAPNIPLLRKAVEWAEAEAVKPVADREWDQMWFAQPAKCGTSYCIAGWAVLYGVPEAQIEDVDVLYIDGESASWWDAAEAALGITQPEAGDLFCPINTIADVRAAAERIAARAGERL